MNTTPTESMRVQYDENSCQDGLLYLTVKYETDPPEEIRLHVTWEDLTGKWHMHGSRGEIGLLCSAEEVLRDLINAVAAKPDVRQLSSDKAQAFKIAIREIGESIRLRLGIDPDIPLDKFLIWT